MRVNTRLCGILTLSILSSPSVVPDKGKSLGESHRKLAILAQYLGLDGVDSRGRLQIF
jgi:hypothetical protein